MLDKNAFLSKAVVNTTKTIKIKAWGDEEVKIRPLTIAESFEVMNTLGALSGEKVKDKPKDVKSLVEAQILCASYALVEPSFSIDELKTLNASAFAGITEIFGAVQELSNEASPSNA